MRNYLIHIVMHDGSHGTCRGEFRNDWDAIDAVFEDTSVSEIFDGQNQH